MSDKPKFAVGDIVKHQPDHAMRWHVMDVIKEGERYRYELVCIDIDDVFEEDI